jgi:hypothetical protein
MIGLMQYWSPLLSLGLLGVWLNAVTGPSAPGVWLGWLNGIVALCTLAATPYMHPSGKKSFRVGVPATVSILLFVFWVTALRTHAQPQTTWWTFFFSLAFGGLAFIAANESTGVVIRHPGSSQTSQTIERPSPLRSVPEPPARTPQLLNEEQIGGTDAYLPRGGYAEPGEGVQGAYWGVGPKGYLRSDLRIADDICEKMALRGDLDASSIEVSVRQGDVTLRGKVADRVSRRLAEAICESVLGVKKIHNDLVLHGEVA